MSESDNSYGSAPRWDANHHRMASWDGHPACRACMYRFGMECMPSTSCVICREWSVETWQRVRKAELRSAKHRLSRAENMLTTDTLKARKIEFSIARIIDPGNHGNTGLEFEAGLTNEPKPLDNVVRLQGGPPPGLTTVDQTQVAAQAIFGQMQAMLAKFEELF